MRTQNKNTLITEESIKRLNEDNLSREDSNNELNKAIERQVNIYLSSVSKREERDQLSKPQLINSHKKTWEWLAKVKQNSPSVVVPEEYLSQDFDPVLYDPNNEYKSEPVTLPTPTSLLSGEEFTENFLQQCLVDDSNMEVKQTRMKDWLLERQGKLNERDKLRAWMNENGFDDVSKHAQQYQTSHPQHTTNQWIEIYGMKSNHLLSTNDLLRLYRNEVPSASRHEMKPLPPNHKQQKRWDPFNTQASNASNTSNNTNNSSFKETNNRSNHISNFHSTHNNMK